MTLKAETIEKIKTWLEGELIASDEEIRSELASSDDKKLKITAEIKIMMKGGGNAKVKCSLNVPREAYKSEPAVFDCQMQLPGM